MTITSGLVHDLSLGDIVNHINIDTFDVKIDLASLQDELHDWSLIDVDTTPVYPQIVGEDKLKIDDYTELIISKRIEYRLIDRLVYDALGLSMDSYRPPVLPESILEYKLDNCRLQLRQLPDYTTTLDLFIDVARLESSSITNCVEQLMNKAYTVLTMIRTPYRLINIDNEQNSPFYRGDDDQVRMSIVQPVIEGRELQLVYNNYRIWQFDPSDKVLELTDMSYDHGTDTIIASVVNYDGKWIQYYSSGNNIIPDVIESPMLTIEEFNDKFDDENRTYPFTSDISIPIIGLNLRDGLTWKFPDMNYVYFMTRADGLYLQSDSDELRMVEEEFTTDLDRVIAYHYDRETSEWIAVSDDRYGHGVDTIQTATDSILRTVENVTLYELTTIIQKA